MFTLMRSAMTTQCLSGNMAANMDPLYLALSFYKRRNSERCTKITTELLDSNPYDEAVWVLKMRSLTEELYVDDIQVEEEGIAEVFLNNDIIGEVTKPGTSLRHTGGGGGGGAICQELRPRSESGRALTGIVRQGAEGSGSKTTMEHALRTPRTGRDIRAITSHSGRNIRLGTASMLAEDRGEFIQISRLNLSKYAQGPTAKYLFEYLYYRENDLEHALELAVEGIRWCRDWWWKVQLGKCYYCLNMMRDAEKCFKLALDEHANIDIYLRLVRVYERLDQPLSALTACKRGLDHFPNEVALLMEIARLHESMNNLTSSVEYYRYVVKEEAVNIEAIACIALHYFYTDQHEAALKFYKRLLEIGIVNVELFNNIALCCFYSQQLDTSLRSFEQALVLGDDGENRADVWYNLSHVAISIGDLNFATHCLRLCLAANGNHAHAFNNLGVIEVRRGRKCEARAFFKIAERLAPLLYEPHLNLAIMSYQLGDLQASYVAAQKAVETNPTSAKCTALLDKVVKHFSSI